MNGEIDFPSKEGLLYLLDEARLVAPPAARAIAGRGDRDQLDLERAIRERLERARDRSRLGERKGAPARADSDQMLGGSSAQLLRLRVRRGRSGVTSVRRVA